MITNLTRSRPAIFMRCRRSSITRCSVPWMATSRIRLRLSLSRQQLTKSVSIKMPMDLSPAAQCSQSERRLHDLSSTPGWSHHGRMDFRLLSQLRKDRFYVCLSRRRATNQEPLPPVWQRSQQAEHLHIRRATRMAMRLFVVATTQ